VVERSGKASRPNPIEGEKGHGDPDNQDYGRDGLKIFIRSQTGRFPNIRLSVEDVITEGDKHSCGSD
jgi:hypothetical protein